MRTFTAVVERDADTGLFIGYVPGFSGAHSQAATLDEPNGWQPARSSYRTAPRA